MGEARERQLDANPTASEFDLRREESKQTSSNGDMYEGGWKEHMRCGQGKQISANGDVYEGGWMENKRHGEGTYTFANGQVCEGQWLNDELLELIQVLVVNRDTGNITKHTCSSAKTLGCFLDRSTK